MTTPARLTVVLVLVGAPGCGEESSLRLDPECYAVECRQQGACTFIGGSCIIGSDGDCAQSLRCIGNGACSPTRFATFKMEQTVNSPISVAIGVHARFAADHRPPAERASLDRTQTVNSQQNAHGWDSAVGRPPPARNDGGGPEDDGQARGNCHRPAERCAAIDHVAVGSFFLIFGGHNAAAARLELFAAQTRTALAR